MWRVEVLRGIMTISKLDPRYETFRHYYLPGLHKCFSLLIQPWNFLFRKFKGGPDWVVERSLAEHALNIWRDTIIKEYQDYDIALETYNRNKARQMTLPELGFGYVSLILITLDHYESSTITSGQPQNGKQTQICRNLLCGVLFVRCTLTQAVHSVDWGAT